MNTFTKIQPSHDSTIGSFYQKSQQILRKTYLGWLNRRIPPSNKVILNHQKIFIFPGTLGFYFVFVVIALFLGGVNYQNSLVLGLCFLLASLGQLATLHTYRNLSGLCIQSGHTENSFAGDKAAFYLTLTRLGKRRYEALKISWEDSVPQMADLLDNVEAQIKFFIPVNKRGVFRPGRLKIETFYPFGILRAWTWIDLDTRCLVYPKPIRMDFISHDGHINSEGIITGYAGDDDFDGLRKYQQGDSLKQVAWKNFARGQGMHSKTFVAYADEAIWLDWNYFHGKESEMRLSALCYWVLKLSEANHVYGLRLPEIEIKPDKGQAHKTHCLETLALFNTTP